MNSSLTNKIGYSNGQFSDSSEITIPVDTISLNRGYGAFDFFGVINNKPFFVNRHLIRFFNTIKILQLNIPQTEREVTTIIYELINKNSETSFYFKLFALPINAAIDSKFESSLHIIPVSATPFESSIYKNGGALITKEYSRFLPEAKSTNYLPMVYWHSEITESKAVDVLYYSNNTIKETSRGNIFIVKDNTFYTPDSGMLKGITRSIIIDILKKKSETIIEKSISVEELFRADEVFLTSTTKKVMPIVEINSKKIGDGKVGLHCLKLIKDFALIQNRN